MRSIFFWHLQLMNHLGWQTNHILQEIMLPSTQLLKLFFPILRPYKILNLHLATLTIAQDKIARRNLIPKSLTLLRQAKWQIWVNRIHDIPKIRKNPLRRFWAQISNMLIILNRPHMSLEHHIELPNLTPVLLATGGTFHIRLQKLISSNALCRSFY